jgi:hypothetical protein
MKKFLRRLARLFLIISYPVLLVALIISLTLFIVRTKELNDLNNTFAQAQGQLNTENENKQVTITDLQQEFKEMTNELSSLRSENASLKSSLEQLQITGYGTISGKILAFVSSGTADFSQYQMVCAESTANTSIQICRTVSAIDQSFTLSVPVGTYKVTAQLYPAPKADSSLASFKGYYSQYVKCVREQGADKCNQAEQTKPVEVVVKAGNSLTNIDPIDWQKR